MSGAGWTPPPPGDPLPACPLCTVVMVPWVEQWQKEIDGIWFFWNIPNYKCSNCGFHKKIGQDRIFNLRIARAILRTYASKELYDYALRIVLDGLGLTKAGLQDILGLTHGNIPRWVHGRFKAQAIYRLVILFLAEDQIRGSTGFLDILRGLGGILPNIHTRTVV